MSESLTYTPPSGARGTTIEAFEESEEHSMRYVEASPSIPDIEQCRTFWGSHGCGLPKGHEPVGHPFGDHTCDCCNCPWDGEANCSCAHGFNRNGEEYFR